MIKSIEEAFPYVNKHLASRNLNVGEKVAHMMTRHMLIETVVNCHNEDEAAERSIDHILERETV